MNKEEILSKFKKKDVEENHYFNPLSPTDNAEECEIYIEALEWALDNKKRIKNIAVSGPFGSGKSSIIQTFINKTKNSNKFLGYRFFPKYKFFNISLATFKDATNNKDATNDTDLQRLIELSILQQLFFHEEDSKIPDSRFKKIKKYSKCILGVYTICFMAFFASILYLLAPEFLSKFINISINPYIAQLISIFGLVLIVYKTSRTFTGLSIRKLNINSAEIEIDDNISKSVLNNHLDEIIYFFEATEYNVVIIEDLDRFEQTEIFTKLREINLLINNSKKVKREVVFIYAIKDDMFLDKERTKFFDFMIPIIPVINFSNSGDKLRKLVEKNKFKISEALLDDLSMFIDDMRLLYNIMNEFYIYFKKFGDNLNEDKLLSIIVYKNICPNDFNQLNENKGDLFKILNKKSEYVKSAKNELDKQIAEVNSNIEIAKEEQNKNIGELRILYIAKVADKLINSKGFKGFMDSSNEISIYDLKNEENFLKLINNQIGYSNNYQSYQALPFKFFEIENEVNPTLKYAEREKIILDKNRINELKKRIGELNEQKNAISKKRIKDLLSNNKIKIDLESNSKNDLINIMLRNGYIDEDYLDYITIFHEGALTKSDYQFLINVKTEKPSSFDFKLYKTEELIKKINEFDFENEYVLNFDLVDALLINTNYSNKKRFLFQQLSNEEAKSISFIDEFIERTTNIELFIIELCKYWTNIWDYIYRESTFPDEKIKKYFTLIIQYAGINEISKIFEKNKQFINDYSDFLNIHIEDGKHKQIIETLGLKFNSIDIDSPKSKLEYIYINYHYSLNIEMIKSILKFKNAFEEEQFNTMNYSFIYSTQLQEIIDYIELDIENYIESVFLKLENNKNEKIDYYTKLLNNEELDAELKDKIIKKTNTIIEDLNNIEDEEICILLFKHSKIKPKWENILAIFQQESNSFIDEVIDYLNNIANAEMLSNLKIKEDKDDEGNRIFSSLCKAIMYNDKIKIESYQLLTQSIPWWYESLETEKITNERMRILIENNIINPQESGYNFLRENYKGLNILLLEKHFDKFKAIIDNINIDSSDFENILKSKIIDKKSKIFFTNNLNDEDIIENAENVKILVKILIELEPLDIQKSVIINLINNMDILSKDRIILFTKYSDLIEKEEVNDFLISLGNNCEQITNTSKKATIDNTELNEKLLETLVNLDYISSISKTEKGLKVHHKRSE